MAKIKIESFLILEKALTKRLVTTWRKFSSGLINRISRAIAKEDWTRVEILIDEINFSRVLTSNKRFMEFIGRGAFLFGVARFDNLKESAFVEDKKPIPFLTEASQNLQSVISEQGDLFVKQNIRRAVATIKERLEAEKIVKAESSFSKIITDAVAILKFRRQKAAKVRTNAQLLRNAVNGQTDQYLENVSSLHNSRLAGWGYVQEAEALGVTTYTVSEQIDSDTICPICISMHGKTFQVSDARSALEQRITIDNLNDLKNVAPFPNQSKAGVQRFRNLSNPDLVESGWHVPPYHPRCRGILVRSDDTANIGPLPSKARVRIPKPQPLPVTRPRIRTVPGLDKIDSAEVRRLFPSLVPTPKKARQALVEKRATEQLLEAIDFADEERLAKKLKGRSVAVQAKITGEFKSIKSDPDVVANMNRVVASYVEADMNPAVLREAPLRRLAIGLENKPRSASRNRLGRYDWSRNSTEVRDLFLLRTTDTTTFIHEMGHHFDYSYGKAINASLVVRRGKTRRLKFRDTSVDMSPELKNIVDGMHSELKAGVRTAGREAKKAGIRFNVKNQSHINALDELPFDTRKSPSGYSLTNDREWVAEASTMYYGSPQTKKALKETLPKTFEFIDALNSGRFIGN